MLICSPALSWHHRPVRAAVAAAALVLTLAACGPSQSEEETAAPVAEETVSEEQATENEPTTEPEQEATSAPEETTGEEPEPAGPPEECDTGAPETPLGEAIMATALPETTTIVSVQELRPDSDVDQSLTWVRVDLCSEPLNSEEHRTLATDIAIAARDAEGGGDAIWRLSVGLYMPDGSGGLRQGRTLYVEDFAVYTWDREAARAPETIWEDNTQ